MKLSIITPTHRLTHIDELYESIKKQTYQDWEWVLYLNGNAKRKFLSKEIEKDPRVSIYVDYNKHSKSTNVGYIKNKAFHLGKGEILLEVDHDDLITPDCLSEVAKAFQANPSVGFVFSHAAIIQDDGIPFNTDFGWANPYQVEWEGKKYWSNGCFTADAGSLSLIYYAPDHVRCWRKSIYIKVGGHNEDLSILDDQELLMRTYMITEFKEIEKCLYMYRVHGENTWLERNQAIQDGTKSLQKEWQRKLAIHDAIKNNLEIVNLADVDFDIHKKWPLADNSVGVLEAYHIINQIEDKVFTMSEIYRVLDDKAWAFLEIPSTDGRGAFQDPRHKSFWNENSFWYWTKRSHADFIDNKSIRFQNMESGTNFPNKFFEDNNIPCTWIFLRAKKADTKRPGTTAI
jgi:glycosyltransferase involved in cell wall biosynthesis